MTPHFLLHHLLTARAASDDPAVVHKDRSLNYREFAEAAARCAAALQEAGTQRGDRVVIYLPRGIEECWSIFGVSMAAGVFVPVNALLKAQQIRHIIRDCGAKIVISDAAMINELNAALADLPDVTILLAEEIGTRTGAPARPSAAIGEDLAAILYTSGSTGSPKGVMLSHRNLLAGARIVRTYLDITGRDRILSLLPFSFDYGLNQLLTAVEQGAATVISTFRLGDEIVRDLRDHAITGLAGVPTIWAILTKAAPSLTKTPLPHLRYITNSGGRVPQETVKALREKLPDTKIYLMYGLTEAFRSTFLPPDEIDRRPTSIGKAIPECEIFIVTAEGQRAKPGEPGILVHRGPTVSLGTGTAGGHGQGAAPSPLHSGGTGRRNRVLFRRSGGGRRGRFLQFRCPQRCNDQIFRLSHQPDRGRGEPDVDGALPAGRCHRPARPLCGRKGSCRGDRRQPEYRCFSRA